MLIYGGIFFSTILLLVMSLKVKNTFVSKLLGILSILIPCLFAGLRSYTTGTDVLVYIKPNYELLKNFDRFTMIFEKFNSEYLYWGITYFFAHFINNFKIYLFILELLVIYPIYFVLKKNSKDGMSVVLGMIIFLTYFYNLSFNMARQSIAIAFSLLAYYYLGKGKNKMVILSMIISILFHSSALILVPIFCLFYINKSNLKKSKKIFLNFLVFLFLVLMAVKFENIISLLSLNSEFRYKNYISKYGLINGKIGIIRLSFWIFILLLCWAYKKNIAFYEKNYIFYLFIGFASILSFYINSKILYSERIFYYLTYPFIFIILSRLPANMKYDYNKKSIFIIISVVFILYWFYAIPINNWNNTFPYAFS